MNMVSSRVTLVLAVASCCLLLLFPPPAAAADGKVTGMITFKGKPLDAGKVIFHLDNDQFVGAKVKDGKYTVDRVPEGARTVTIEAKGIPLKYTLEHTSGLKLQVKEGTQTHDINLR
jgi:hypothetical protein